LQHYPETWVDTEFTPYRAYGFRLYRNNSQLRMHVDKSQTHVVSFILHIDSSEDSEPWPIVIEDFHGSKSVKLWVVRFKWTQKKLESHSPFFFLYVDTHEVVLTSGDMLLYESSKCFHGRPHRFKGSWYSSVFVHYYPKYGWKETKHDLEKHYAVPPVWNIPPTHHFEVPLEMVGTGMKEPSCPNDWCQTQHTIKWSGPGEDGYLTDPTGDKYPFDPKPLVCEDSHKDCSSWASWDSDECSRNPGYMLTHCKKSCGDCTANAGNDEL
jgi:hypothetical protein